jgi:hypothetical protein
MTKESWSEITREDWQLVEAEKRCIYCGSESDLHKEHIAPKSLKIRPECASCDVIQGIHNQIWACSGCNSSKGTKGLYEFYRKKYPHERKFYDLIPPLLEKKYLSGYGSVPTPRREVDSQWRKPSLTGLPFVCGDIRPCFAKATQGKRRRGGIDYR